MGKKNRVICEVLMGNDSDGKSPEKIMIGSKKLYHKKLYQRRVPSKWLNDPRFNSWLCQSKKNENKAYCMACDNELTGNIVVIERHCRADKHLKNMSKRNICTDVSIEDSKIANIKYAKTKRSPNITMGGQSFTVHEVMPEYFSDQKTQMENNKHSKCENKESEDEFENIPHENKIYIASNAQEDEFDIFGKHVASQIRKLPEKYNIKLISDIQNLITQKRLEALSEQNSQMQSAFAPKIINVISNGSISS